MILIIHLTFLGFNSGTGTEFSLESFKSYFNGDALAFKFRVIPRVN